MYNVNLFRKEMCSLGFSDWIFCKKKRWKHYYPKPLWGDHMFYVLVWGFIIILCSDGVLICFQSGNLSMQHLSIWIDGLNRGKRDLFHFPLKKLRCFHNSNHISSQQDTLSISHYRVLGHLLWTGPLTGTVRACCGRFECISHCQVSFSRGSAQCAPSCAGSLWHWLWCVSVRMCDIHLDCTYVHKSKYSEFILNIHRYI